MDKKITIDTIVDSEARATVGKMMKRLEIIAKQDIPYKEKEILFKKLAKELTYEGSRSLKKMLKLYGLYENVEITDYKQRA